MKFKNRLQKIRLEKGFSIKQMAAMAGIPVSTYKEWENGRKIPAHLLLTLTSAARISIYQVYEEDSTRADVRIEILSLLDEVTNKVLKL